MLSLLVAAASFITQEPLEVEPAPKPADVARAEIQQAYDDLANATARLDLPNIVRFWAPKYFTIDPEGFVTGRRELEAGYKAQAKLGIRGPVRRASKIMKFSYPKLDQARTRVFHSAAFDLPKAPLSPLEEKVQWEEHQDFWVKQDGKWVLTKSEILRNWNEIRRRLLTPKDPNRDRGGGSGGSGSGGG